MIAQIVENNSYKLTRNYQYQFANNFVALSGIVGDIVTTGDGLYLQEQYVCTLS